LDLRYANVSPETAAALRQRFTETLYV
jgi:hypothetical protein